ncbi:MAG: hypothetical protein WC358_03535 [Ignavibacteria bacterium]|jgi:hypothetical protein
MRLSILCEGLDAPRSILEDGEGMSAGALGDATAAGAVGPSGDAVPGITSTADVAMYPKYLGFSYRGGTINFRGKKKKSLHEETLNQFLGAILEDYSSKLSKNAEIKMLPEED